MRSLVKNIKDGDGDAVAKPVRFPEKIIKDGDAYAMAKLVRSPAKRIKEETGKQSTNQPCSEMRMSSGCPDDMISPHHWPLTFSGYLSFFPRWTQPVSEVNKDGPSVNTMHRKPQEKTEYFMALTASFSTDDLKNKRDTELHLQAIFSPAKHMLNSDTHSLVMGT